MVKYSVIVPVYNAEKTLHRCVDSLLNQNYRDFELILVDDGSSDGSSAICEAYAGQHPCVVYIHKPNGGVSTARNAGLDAATGEYVLFVDSDDYVSEDYFRTLDSLDPEGRYDFLTFSHSVTDGRDIHPQIARDFASDCAEESVPMFCRMLSTKAINPPWNKRYLRKRLADNCVRFPENLYIGEDKCFNLQYVMHCTSCLVSPEPLYYVSVENDQSLSRKIRPDLSRQFDIIDARIQQTIRESAIPENFRAQYIAAENLIQLRAVYSEAKRMHLTGKDRRTRRSTIRKMCDDLNQSGMPLPKGMFSAALKLPVRFRCITLLDIAGKILAKT